MNVASYISKYTTSDVFRSSRGLLIRLILAPSFKSSGTVMRLLLTLFVELSRSLVLKLLSFK